MVRSISKRYDAFIPGLLLCFAVMECRKFVSIYCDATVSHIAHLHDFYCCRVFTIFEISAVLVVTFCDAVLNCPLTSATLHNGGHRLEVGTKTKLECGPVPKVMVALLNIGGALCSTLQSLADARYLTAVQ